MRKFINCSLLQKKVKCVKKVFPLVWSLFYDWGMYTSAARSQKCREL